MSKMRLKYKAVAKIGAALKTEFPDYTDFSTVDGVPLSAKTWLAAGSGFWNGTAYPFNC